jgi:class 3 adenylate cyclase/tetratricopeptide (TPR) repeat protein
MRCSNCDFDNPAGMSFCGSCGTRLVLGCAACGAENPPGFRFCGQCGSALPGAAAAAPAPCPPAAAPRAVPGGGEAERRQLTVMFCDLAGSTALSERLDPEELREIVRSYQAACAEVIEGYEGYIAQYLGDGVLAYFGYPIATEHEAVRAVRAGRGIIAAMERLNGKLRLEYSESLAVRIGIHTGVVVVGEVGGGQRREHLALGETPNLAARIQGVARPDTVAISAETLRLLGDDFEVAELGEHALRGIAAPMRLYEVTGERIRPQAGRLLEVGARVVGRDPEVGMLATRWGRVAAGAGQVVLVTGDAGIGKTSLARSFISTLEPGSFALLEGRCLPYYRTTAYRPITDLLWEGEESVLDELPVDRLRRLSARLEKAGLERPETGAILASLLSTPGESPAPIGVSPHQIQERTRTVMLQLLLGYSSERPLVLLLEDVHWADPSTLELLGMLVNEVQTRPILLLLTARPEFESPWEHAPHALHLPLTRLGSEEVGRIILRVTAGKALPAEVMEQIVRRTDGVPLFAEELTRTVIESGLLREADDRYELVGPLPPFAIPATLHDSLEARLERLSATKELVQLGSILGREFGYELLFAVAELDEPTLRQSLAQLVHAELLEEGGTPTQTTYLFKHALIQEAAYQSLLKGVRQMYHLRVARALEDRFPERAHAEPEVLAQHYAGAGLAEPAIRFWSCAGRRAVERSANREAAAHTREGLALLSALPAGATRDELELALLLARGPALIVTEGHASAPVREAYTRAVELSRGGGSPAQHFQVLGGLITSYLVRAELDEAQTAAAELLGLATGSGEDGWQMAAQVCLGVCAFERGQVEPARRLFESGIHLYRAEKHFSLAFWIGQDYGVVGLAYMAYALFALGHLDQAARCAREAVTLARRLDHPHSLAFALAFASYTAYLRREPEAVLALTGELMEIATREGYDHWMARPPLLRAWALVDLGRVQEGVAAISGYRLSDRLRAGPVEEITCAWTSGEAYLAAGMAREAMPHLDRARFILERFPDQPWWAPEIERLRGLALARLGRGAEADESLARAVEISGRSGGRTLLLRALTDLALNASTAEGRAAAVQGLRGVYASFTEGRDLPDLRAAAAVVGEAVMSYELKVMS